MQADDALSPAAAAAIRALTAEVSALRAELKVGLAVAAAAATSIESLGAMHVASASTQLRETAEAFCDGRGEVFRAGRDDRLVEVLS